MIPLQVDLDRSVSFSCLEKQIVIKPLLLHEVLYTDMYPLCTPRTTFILILQKPGLQFSVFEVSTVRKGSTYLPALRT